MTQDLLSLPQHVEVELREHCGKIETCFRRSGTWVEMSMWENSRHIPTLDIHKETLTGDVGDHGENEEGIIIKGEVILVGQSDRVEPCLLNIRQSSVDGQKFSSHSHRVEYNKKGVSTDRCDIGLYEFNAYTE